MTPGERKALDNFVTSVRNHYGERLDQIVMFGSRARGDDRPDSDVDLAIILRDAVGDYWEEKLLLADMSGDALLEVGLIIQSFPISRAEWTVPETHRNPRFVRSIRRDARPIGELV